MKRILLAVLCVVVGVCVVCAESRWDECRWQMLDPTGDPTGRHECVFVAYEDKFYLLGGRGVLPVNVYDPQTNSWTEKGKTPIEINHFQAVVYGDLIYVVCAMNGNYPTELPLQHVWIYNPRTDVWRQGGAIPAAFQRGGGGAVVYKDKIYVACGIDYGHTSGTSNLFSCYDPRTDSWSALTKAPHIRDHFAAIVVGDKLYCIGGRNSSYHYPDAFGAFFKAVVPEVDVYDFVEGKWATLREPLPVPTAAGGVVVDGNEIIYMGGEGDQPLAFSQTQCLDLATGKWRQLAPMAQGMHGASAILYDGAIYWAAGSYRMGGSDLNTIQRMGL